MLKCWARDIDGLIVNCKQNGAKLNGRSTHMQMSAVSQMAMSSIDSTNDKFSYRVITRPLHGVKFFMCHGRGQHESVSFRIRLRAAGHRLLNESHPPSGCEQKMDFVVIEVNAKSQIIPATQFIAFSRPIQHPRPSHPLVHIILCIPFFTLPALSHSQRSPVLVCVAILLLSALIYIIYFDRHTLHMNPKR